MNKCNQRTQAWIGDAVLALYAREWILTQKQLAHSERAEMFKRMTSNRFLATIGEPTAMEAEIGSVYHTDGLKAAFAFIETKFLARFLLQEKKRTKIGSYRNR
jgi:dsRNA-specific ribonuclease